MCYMSSMCLYLRCIGKVSERICDSSPDPKQQAINTVNI